MLTSCYTLKFLAGKKIVLSNSHFGRNVIFFAKCLGELDSVFWYISYCSEATIQKLSGKVCFLNKFLEDNYKLKFTWHRLDKDKKNSKIFLYFL
jgi:hypothetical protein